MIIKQHKIVWISFLIITSISLIVALTTSATIDLWGLTYSVLMLFPCFAISFLLRFYNQEKTISMAKNNEAKRKIFVHSILLSLLWSFFIFVPLLIGLIINFLINTEIFNLYMLLSYFLVSYLIFHIANYFDLKCNDKKENKNQL